MVDGKPFRFVGANLDLMFQKDTRAHMPNMMRFAAEQGMTVVRVWATGEGGLDDVQPANNWKRDRWFRLKPEEWNEEEFVFLDQVIAEAARNGLRVQLCLAPQQALRQGELRNRMQRRMVPPQRSRAAQQEGRRVAPCAKQGFGIP